ncbi:MAG: Holliday junction branch migration protein RuvA [Ferruginibacter sp.]|nr:Holliday junction branch migration protein RuvA [Bacteroidota bacterium]MBX2920137.1 Holliday junction branch migration protein RuvA [Ferruginibacter sp.]MCB0709508.1 Holliday junction branch migration protein RuvA [Chitinophagaceae bacterium]MCC7379507.1 Holliday junction branch migration protein RuvA [Chitinophagaceae bacterium]
MYAYLQGKFTFKNPAQVYVDVNGIGFEVNISLNTYSNIQHLNEGRLFTYLQVKEDAHVLFGFFDKQEKDMFVMLTGVSGIGAVTARMMLSSLKPEEVSAAIVQNNVKLLESIKGIGKKTAERLVLELKDKMGKIGTGVTASVHMGNSLEADALNALTALGISKAQAENSIQNIIRAEPSVLKLEDLIKKALKAI